MRPMLRPGLKILRRDAETVQLGLDWPGVTALRETPALRSVLEAIDGFRDAAGVVLAATASGPTREHCETALAVLVDCGAVVDSRARQAPHLTESSESALWLLAGPGRGPRELVQARLGCAVWVDGSGAVADALRQLIEVANLGVCRDRLDASVVILAGDCEPDRDRADAMMHAGRPHLWVYVRDLVGIVGPFVVPGATACLRCTDAARADCDPAWPTLVVSATVKPLPVPACDAVLATLVAAWAAQEVSLWASDIRPQTCGRVVEVPLGCGPVECVTFDVHPSCGCGWPVWQDTMGA